MTHCGAEISYAVYLVMAGDTVSTIVFFYVIWTSSWRHTDFCVLLNEQKEKPTLCSITSFLLVYFSVA